MNIKSLIKKTSLYKFYVEKRYGNYIKKKNARNLVFKKEASSVLQKFCTALNEDNIVFWLEFGTLLGYYREHDFIHHDSDIDTGAYLKDAEQVRAALKKHGFERVRFYHVLGEDGFEECYKHIDYQTTIDVFYFREDGNVLYCNTFLPLRDMNKKKYVNKEIPCQVKRIDVPNCGYIETEFKGNKVYVPSDCELYLKMHYGNNFMIPNPNFSSRKEARNIVYFPYSEKKGVCVFTQEY